MKLNFKIFIKQRVCTFVYKNCTSYCKVEINGRSMKTKLYFECNLIKVKTF